MKSYLTPSDEMVEIVLQAFETGVQWASVFVRDGTELNTEAKAAYRRNIGKKSLRGLKRQARYEHPSRQKLHRHTSPLN